MRSPYQITFGPSTSAVPQITGTALASSAVGILKSFNDLNSQYDFYCGIQPLDVNGLAASVGNTGRLVVVEEGPPVGGYASEVISAVAELVSPVRVRRVSMPDLPIPFSCTLEDATLPSVASVMAAARSLLDPRAPKDSGAR